MGVPSASKSPSALSGLDYISPNMNAKLFEKGCDVAEGNLNNDITLSNYKYQQGLFSLGFGLSPFLFVCFVLFNEALVRAA